MANQKNKYFLDDDGARLTTHVSAYGATVYMNRQAILKLISELSKIAEADPKECYEIHLSRYFAYFDKDEEYVEAPIKYTLGLEAHFQKQFEDDMLAEAEAGKEVEGATRTPFEVSIMHISDEALIKDADDRNEIDGLRSYQFTCKL